MSSSPGEVLRMEIECLQRGQALFSEVGKLVKELLERFALRLCLMREAVKGIEWPGFAVLQEDTQSRHPVGALPGDQVADNVVCAPGIFSFVGVCPNVGHASQERIQGCGGAGEKCRGLGRVEFRWACHVLRRYMLGGVDSSDPIAGQSC